MIWRSSREAELWFKSGNRSLIRALHAAFINLKDYKAQLEPFCALDMIELEVEVV